MKLERIQIIGFGRLRDLEVTFSAGITIILGANESGKTTLQRAVRAALYGLEAGGQGRPVERSEWYRWRPWTSGPYGLVLTYARRDGRRFRVAADLDSRGRRVEVHELGGGNVTNDMRIGRLVAPGARHLGIDETVFSATAWVGEDGLRLGAADGPAPRRAEIQEAIERLADSGDNATALEAASRLREAMDRVGSERRANSPLGVAVTRLRQIDSLLSQARARSAAVASDETRLRQLEAVAAVSARRSATAEVEWLRGRVAALAAQQTEMTALKVELDECTAVLDETDVVATFPVVDEERVPALGGELRQAKLACNEAEARWAAAQAELDDVQHRRAEIRDGLIALGPLVAVSAEQLGHGQRLAADLDVQQSALGRHDLVAEQARREALSREIAATGLGAVPAGAASALQPIVAAALGAGRRRLLTAAVAMLVSTAIAIALAWWAQRPQFVWAAAGLGLVTLALVGISWRTGATNPAQARRHLQRLCPGLDTTYAGLIRTSERLPQLAALHEELQKQDTVIAARADELDEIRARIQDLSDAARGLAAAVHVDVLDDGATDPASRCRAVLDGVFAAAESAERRRELAVEDRWLATSEERLLGLRADLDRLGEQAAEIEDRLRVVLSRAGIPPETPAPIAVGMFRDHCQARRRRDGAVQRAETVRRRLALLGDIDHVEAHRRRFEAELQERGVEPSIDAVTPLDPARLAEIERDVDRARQMAVAANTDAVRLRAQVAAASDGLPSLADLEDERIAWVERRDHALRQLEALRYAMTVIQETARGVHRDLAPRLAGYVGERLALITEGRYQEVNVDTEHFAVSLLGPERLELVPLDAVSHGTRDQVSLLLRLALANVLSESAEPMPLLLDEPLLSSDPQRRRAAVDFLVQLSAEQQIVVSTSDPSLAMLLAGSAREAAVVELASPDTDTNVLRLNLGGRAARVRIDGDQAQQI